MRIPGRDLVMRMFAGPNWKAKRAKKVAEKDRLAEEQRLVEKEQKQEEKKQKQDRMLNSAFKKE